MTSFLLAAALALPTLSPAECDDTEVVTNVALPTIQRFEIDSQGSVTIRKFSHSIRRAIDNKVWLDGVRVN